MAKRTTKGTRTTSFTLAEYTSKIPTGGFLRSDLAGLPTKVMWVGPPLKHSKSCKTKGVLGIHKGKG